MHLKAISKKKPKLMKIDRKISSANVHDTIKRLSEPFKFNVSAADGFTRKPYTGPDFYKTAIAFDHVVCFGTG